MSPKPRFKVGDKVRIVNVANPMMIGEIGIIEELPPKDRSHYIVKLTEDEWTLLEAKNLGPYTEPENKDNDMETKKLNLTGLLSGHKEETFYSPIWGDCSFVEIHNRNGNWPMVKVRISNGECRKVAPSGHLTYNVQKCGLPILFPSRTLYEQYPLKPYTAWQKWAEEQKKYSLAISWQKYDNRTPSGGVDLPSIRFRTPADRDKAVEEIRSVIEKYSNGK